MSNLPLKYLTFLRNGTFKPEEIVTKGCLNPRLLSLRSANDSISRSQFVGCGKCFNCSNERRKEWVSRMCLHSLSWKFCYFVTLTYGSYDLSKFIKHPFLADWQETCPHIDTWNYSMSPKITPSLIVHSHCQKFLKRLRVIHLDSISFAACGEYGHTWGRPHFHLILWSNTPISRAEVVSAWSLMCVRTKNPRIVLSYRRKDTDPERIFRFRLGKVDFVDLVANGTLDWNALEPKKDKNGTFCFNYVAKYLCKTDSIPPFALNRIRWAFSLLPKSQDLSLADDGSDSKFYKQFILNSKVYGKCSLPEFQKIVSPFFRSSRLYSLGKQYFLENLQRFKTGNYKLPTFCGRELVFPHFFYRLLDQSTQPFRLDKIVLSGHSLSKGSYPAIIHWFEEFRDNRAYLSLIYRYFKSSSPLPQQKDLLYKDGANVAFEDFLSSPDKNGSIFYLKLLQLDNSPLYVRYSWASDLFEFYTFDRSTLSYNFVEYDERPDFCDWIITLLKNSISNYRRKLPSLSAKFTLDSEVLGKLSGDSVSFDNPDDVSLYERMRAAVSDYMCRRNCDQSHYDVTHITTDKQ